MWPHSGGAVHALRCPLTVFATQPYHATLQEGGKVIYSRSDLKTEDDEKVGRVAVIEVPAHLLRPRRYKITLSGITADSQARRDINSYTFQVLRP